LCPTQPSSCSTVQNDLGLSVETCSAPGHDSCGSDASTPLEDKLYCLNSGSTSGNQCRYCNADHSSRRCMVTGGSAVSRGRWLDCRDWCFTCDDGVKNGDELGIDCGGDYSLNGEMVSSGCQACPSCSDGIQNGEEEGVDCGSKPLGSGANSGLSHYPPASPADETCDPCPTTTVAPTTATPHGSRLRDGAPTGIIVGAICGGVVVLFVIIFCIWKKKQKAAAATNEGGDGAQKI